MNPVAIRPWRVCSIVLTAASLLFPSPATQASEALNLLTWERYLSEAVIDRWQA